VLPSGLYLYLDQLVHRSRTPFVLWALGSDVNKYKSNPIVRLALKRIAGRAGQVYADGFRLCRDLSEITGVDCQFLPTFRRLDVPDDPIARKTSGTQRRLLYVGRHTAVKGTDVLVEALGLLKRELAAPNYHMELVGDGDLTPDLKRRIAESGLGGQVTFRGQLSDQALASAYCAADCVVIPSRSESIPLVLSEALQFNRPLIVTDVGDMGDLVRRHQLGEVVPAGDARALAQSMRRFIAEPWRLDEAASADLLREWTFEGAAPKLLARLETLVRK
jgi:glycosyltransferase involved in cell wall biosynthesis